MTQQHIDNDKLSLFVKTTSFPDDSSMNSMTMNSLQYHEVLDHLAICEECRDQVSIITTLQNNHSQIPYESDLTDEQQQLICDYIDGSLASDEAAQAKALIENQPDAMRAALHYQSHVESMRPHLEKQHSVDTEPSRIELNRKSNTSSPVSSKSNTMSKILLLVNQFVNLQSPMIYTMSATAAVLIAVFSVLQSPDIKRNQPVIASYQDNATIQFTDKDKLPGVGFFSQSGTSSKPFNNINIELLTENTVKISWPEIDGAELYKMRLQVFNQGKKIVLKEASTESNHATFQLYKKQIADTKIPSDEDSFLNQRYEWVLYGNTVENKMFYASGGFVIDHLEANTHDD